MFSTETTYYIPASMIRTENGLKSPNGDSILAWNVGECYRRANSSYANNTNIGVRPAIDVPKSKLQ